jgi:hypothetical protein
MSSHTAGSIVRNPVAAAAASHSEPIFIDLSKTSLVELCQDLIVNQFEKYPPQAFACLPFDLDDFESLIRLKHSKTKPKEGSGGLDGTGRVAPAVRADYILELEATLPHLANSTVVDTLVWKDCVEFRFKRGGMTRPRALNLPWPLLVQGIQTAGQELSLRKHESLEDPEAAACIHTLESCPMNVSLLQATAIGKTVKEILKRHQHDQTSGYQKLTLLLKTWKELAARNGVSQSLATSATSNASPTSLTSSDNSYDNEAEDLKLAESCKTWRQLFAGLKQKEDERRSNLGKEMRQRRKNLASDRPRIVKVRPTNVKREQLLVRGTPVLSQQQSLQHNKMTQLRKESYQVAARTRVTSGTTVGAGHAAPKTGGSFGAAVAFAASYNKTSSSSASGKQKSRTNGSTHVHRLEGGKLMSVPSKVAKKAAMARQWKGTR